MIKHEFKNCGGLVEAKVNWKFTDSVKSVSNKCNSIELAHQFVTKVERKLIIDSITKYINHRTFMYENSFSLVYSMSKANSLARIKELKELMTGLNFIGLCRTILIYKKDLIEVMPSSRSKFYKHDATTLLEIFKDCEAFLEPNKTA